MKTLISNSKVNGKKLAKKLGDHLVSEFQKEKYPDTENLIAVNRKSGAPANLIYYQFNDSETLDEQLFDLLCLVDKFADPRVTRLVLPYTPYGRAVVGKGEIDKLSFFLQELIKKVSALYVIALHANIEQLKKQNPSLKKLVSVDVDDQIIALVKKIKGNQKAMLVSPDSGFAGTVSRIAKKMNVPYAVLAKTRLSPTTVSVRADVKTKKKIREHKNDHFIILDDIIGTGDTLKKATSLLRSQGAKHFSYVVIHDTRRKNSQSSLRVHCSNSLMAAKAHPSFDLTGSIVRALKSR